MTHAPQFLTFCPKHGCDIHAGDKNECCDTAGMLPMLTAETFDSLNETGRNQFIQDFSVLTSAGLELPAAVLTWIGGIGPILEAAATPPEEISGGEGDEGGFSLYIQGFESGFTLGYDKGFEMGKRILPAKNGK